MILLHRDGFYLHGPPRTGDAELTDVKHRHGPEATVPVTHQGHYTRFVDMAVALSRNAQRHRHGTTMRVEGDYVDFMASWRSGSASPGC